METRSRFGTKIRALRRRENLTQAQLSKDVKAALDEQRWADARRALEKLIASAAPLPVKTQARRTLADLDRLKLGVEETKP